MFIIAFKSKSGYLLGLGAIYADGSRWLRWGIPSVISARDYPRVIVYNTRKEGAQPRQLCYETRQET